MGSRLLAEALQKTTGFTVVSDPWASDNVNREGGALSNVAARVHTQGLRHQRAGSLHHSGTFHIQQQCCQKHKMADETQAAGARNAESRNRRRPELMRPAVVGALGLFRFAGPGLSEICFLDFFWFALGKPDSLERLIAVGIKSQRHGFECGT